MKIIEPLISALVVVLMYVCAVGFVVYAVRFVKIIVPLILLLVSLATFLYLFGLMATVKFIVALFVIGWAFGPEYDRLTGRRD
jgi:hypothetical protein